MSALARMSRRGAAGSDSFPSPPNPSKILGVWHWQRGLTLDGDPRVISWESVVNRASGGGKISLDDNGVASYRPSIGTTGLRFADGDALIKYPFEFAGVAYFAVRWIADVAIGDQIVATIGRGAPTQNYQRLMYIDAADSPSAQFWDDGIVIYQRIDTPTSPSIRGGVAALYRAPGLADRITWLRTHDSVGTITSIRGPIGSGPVTYPADAGYIQVSSASGTFALKGEIHSLAVWEGVSGEPSAANLEDAVTYLWNLP